MSGPAKESKTQRVKRYWPPLLPDRRAPCRVEDNSEICLVPEVFSCHRRSNEGPQQTGLLPVLAVTAAVAGLIWWRRHQQSASQPRKSPQERTSRFQFPRGKAASAGNSRYLEPMPHDSCVHSAMHVVSP